MPLTTNQVFDCLVAYVRPHLYGLGFEYDSSQKFFIRRFEAGYQIIRFNLGRLGDRFRIGVRFCIRVEEVEEIVSLFRSRTSNFAETLSIGHRSLLGHDVPFIEPTTLAELELAKIEILDILLDRGCSLFDSCLDLLMVNEMKKKLLFAGRIGVLDIDLTIMQSFTLMRLSHDADFHILRDEYRKLYQNYLGFSGTAKCKFDELAEYLLHYPTDY